MMHGHEKSDSVIVAMKPANKAERSAAELVEPRAETKGNAGRQSTCRTSVAPRLALRCARACVAGASAVDVERPCGALHDLLGDHHFLDTFEARQVEHGVEQDTLHDRAQAAGAGLAGDGLAGDGAERFLH